MIEFYISSTKYTLQERQTKRGKVYDVCFRVVTLSGEEKQKKLCGFFTKTAAKQAYTDFITSKCELVKNNPLKQKKADQSINKNVYTVKEAHAAYIAALTNQVKESTVYDRQNIYRLFIEPQLEDVRIDQLTAEILYKWQDDLWGSKNPRTDSFYSYAYLSKVRGVFSVFLAWIETRYGVRNNMSAVKKPRRREPKREMQIWTREEFERFIEVVDDPTYKMLFMTLFFAGCRKGEALALTPSDVKNGALYINKAIMRKTIDDAAYKITPTKAYNNREVPLCEPLKKAFAEYLPTVKEGAFLFGGSRSIPQTSLDRAWDRYKKAANVKDIRLHDLRHSFVSMLIHLGANLTVVADLIGDTLEQVTKTYAHVYEDDKGAVLNRIK